MESNADQQNQLSPSVSIPIEVNTEVRNSSPQTCGNCEENNLECDSSTPCSSCISLGKSNNCAIKSNTAESVKTPAKRGYKSHVPSACINCRIAHLACDVSRPCQRCVTLKKTDTCHDIRHKKRGRPKLREKKVYRPDEHSFEILYGTIETPTIAMNYAPRNITPSNQVPPFKTKLANISKGPPAISFIHSPIESFQKKNEPRSLTSTTAATILPNDNITDTIYQQNIITSIPSATVPLTFDYSSTSGNDSLLLESVLPNLQITSNANVPLLTTQQQQQLIFDYSPLNSNDTTPVLLNNGSPTTNIQPTNHIQQQSKEIQYENNKFLSIIMSMEVCCAKVSDDTIKYWGYYPQELAHRSFYDFISPKDSDRLARLHRLLLDNAMGANKNDANSNTAPLPPTERTTSSLFSNTDHSTLNLIANGSRSFSDSIHIKKRSGELELYKVVVYIGGGLGADLYDTSSFSKQYIVAQFRKHEYEVSSQPEIRCLATTPLPRKDESNTAEDLYYNIQPITAFSPLSPLSPTSPSTSSSTVNFNNSPKSDMSLFSNKNRNQKRLSTTSKFSQMSIIPPTSPPKFHIAPITTPNTNTTSSFHTKKSFSKSLFRKFPPSVSSSALAASSAVVSSPTSVRLRSTDNAIVTHPTQQYFLQTSSSTLNAAASAAQSKSRLSISGPTNNDNTSTTNRKMEMSIRSLLC